MSRDEESPRPAYRVSSRLLLWVGALAALVRLLYFAEHAGSPFFGFPVLDERYYDDLSRLLAAGDDPRGLNPGFRPYLYPLFLAACRVAAGVGGPFLAIAVQHLLGVATAVLVAALAARLLRRDAAGAVAGGAYALAGPPLYFEGELLITSVFTFLVTLHLAFLAREATAPAARRGRWSAAAGAAVALAVQARANALAYLVAFPVAALRRRRGDLRTAAVGLLAAAVVTVLWAAATRPWTGGFQLLPSAGGVNLYLGNERGADGMVPRQDRAVVQGTGYRDSVAVWAEESYREARWGGPRAGPAAVPPAEVSRYWLRRTAEEITADPGRWLRLLGRKAWLLLWNREVPNNKSFAFVAREESPILRHLPVRWWLLVALAPLGAVAARRDGDRRLLYWLVAFLALHAAATVAFFVNARYRLPMWPAMCVLAGAGAVFLADAAHDAVRRRRFGPFVAALAAAGLLAAASLGNWLGLEPPGFGRDHFFRSLARLERGDLDGAADDAQRAAELEPADPAMHAQVGNVALARDDAATAVAAFRRAVALAPGEPRAVNNLGVALEALGRPAAALDRYREAAELAGGYPPAMVNAAFVELRLGRDADAARHLAAARRHGWDDVSLLVAEGVLARRRGDAVRGERLLAEARDRDPGRTARLLADLARPLAEPP